ncbi:MAG: tRNA (adenosine(37)-N6)-dimethylallyltransferase MiaA [Gammaproteobacteria bacterium]
MRALSKLSLPAIFLMGPTACGKTGLAVEIVQRLPCEIISVDSAMVYKHMDIGTAKPDAETLARAPHRLIDFVDPAEAYSAARFRADALREADTVARSGRVPLFVGGTMLYFRALSTGLSDLPAADAQVRARIDAQARERGWERLHDRLREIDPASAARIDANDPQRIQRALEVFELTGSPMSALFDERSGPQFPYRSLRLALVPQDRALLHERIARRFRGMLDQGLINEVMALYKRGDLYAELPSMRAVGYRQVWQYLDKRLEYDEMAARAVTATRQLAKRQLTWLRKEPCIRRLKVESYRLPDVIKEVAAYLDQVS